MQRKVESTDPSPFMIHTVKMDLEVKVAKACDQEEADELAMAAIMDRMQEMVDGFEESMEEPRIELVDAMIPKFGVRLAMKQEPQRPLEPGTLIAYQDMVATVLNDDGGPLISVRTSDDCEEIWNWEFEGIKCKVVAVASEETNVLSNRILVLEAFLQSIATDDRLAFFATSSSPRTYQQDAKKLLGW